MNMNIKDIKNTEIKGDKLELIFQRQKELEDKYKKIEQDNGFYVPNTIDLDNAHDQLYVKNLTHRVIEELEEGMNCLKNKPWKQTQMETDKEHFVEELADGFHFYIALLLSIDMSAEDLFQIYFKKSEVNKFRQRSRY